jgi:acetyl-CoA acetyltransferase
MMRDPLTIPDVLNSRLVAEPLHLLDCCLVTDGGGAVIVASAERARDTRKVPV